MIRPDLIEVKVNIPRNINTKLQAMGRAYGVTKNAIILMILGDTITGVETATRSMTEGLKNMDHMTDENKEILDALNK